MREYQKQAFAEKHLINFLTCQKIGQLLKMKNTKIRTENTKWFDFIDEIVNNQSSKEDGTNGTMERFSKQESTNNNQ